MNRIDGWMNKMKWNIKVVSNFCVSFHFQFSISATTTKQKKNKILRIHYKGLYEFFGCWTYIIWFINDDNLKIYYIFQCMNCSNNGLKYLQWWWNQMMSIEGEWNREKEGEWEPK